MEWNLLTAQNLTIIEREVNRGSLSPAEYEILRRVIYATGDFDYSPLVTFGEYPIPSARAALKGRMPVLVDTPIIQTGIYEILQQTFLNPIYCLEEISLSASFLDGKMKIWRNLALRYPSAIYVIGDNPLILVSILDLMDVFQIKPSLIIFTASGFTRKEIINNRLKNSLIPHVRIDSSKGGINTAIAICEGLIDLAWITENQTLK